MRFLFILHVSLYFFSNLSLANTLAPPFKLSYHKVVDTSVNRENIIYQDFIKMPSSSSLGYKNGTYWFQLEVINTKEDNNEIIYIPTHNIEKAILFKLTEGKLIQQGVSGNSIASQKLAYNYKFPTFVLKPRKEEKSIYFLKVHFPKEANFPLAILNENVFHSKTLSNQSFHSFYYGLVLMILILNLFFYLKFRKIIFIYYAIFLLSMSMGMLLYDGSFINLFRTLPYGKHLEFSMRLLEEISLILFSISFLELKSKTPIFVKYVFIFPFTMVLFYCLYLYTDAFIFEALGDVIGISVFLYIWLIGIAHLKKTIYAKFFVLGYLLILPVGIYYFIGYGFGLWQINGDIKWAKIAGFVDILVFSYALTYRMKVREEENKNMVIELKRLIENSDLLKDTPKNKVDPYLQLLSTNNLTSEPLTIREIELLKDIVQGLTNSQIAEKNFISINTVKTHIRNIYSKLEINNRDELRTFVHSTIH